MTAPNPETRALYNRLREVLGDDHADTLMTFLPPQPAAELATKADITDLKQGLERVHDRIDTLHYQLADQLKTYTIVMVATLTALAGILGTVFAVVLS